MNWIRRFSEEHRIELGRYLDMRGPHPGRRYDYIKRRRMEMLRAKFLDKRA